MTQQERIKEIDAELKILKIIVSPLSVHMKMLGSERKKLVWEIQVNENLRKRDSEFKENGESQGMEEKAK